MAKSLIVVGASSTAEVMAEYFLTEGERKISCFAVEASHLQENKICGLPVVAFENVVDICDPSEHDVFVAVSYGQLNRLRTRLLDRSRKLGFGVTSFISRHALVAASAKIGPHAFVFEQNNVQPFVEVGENVVLWSGNHIGHHSRIGSNCFISSHVVVSGHCEIGDNCFLGVNATIANNVVIGRDCWVGPGSVVTKDLPDRSMVRGPGAEIARVDTHRFFRLESIEQT